MSYANCEGWPTTHTGSYEYASCGHYHTSRGLRRMCGACTERWLEDEPGPAHRDPVKADPRDDRIASLSAENARMREALAGIAAAADIGARTACSEADCGGFAILRDEARTALSGEGGAKCGPEREA